MGFNLKFLTLLCPGKPQISLPAEMRLSSGVLFESFDTTGEWTGGGGAGWVIEGNAVQVQEGTQSLKVTTAAGELARATKTIAADLSAAQRITLAIYLHDITDFASMSHYLATRADFSQYFILNLSVTNLFAVAWTQVVTSPSDWTVVGGAVWTDPILRLRVSHSGLPTKLAAASYDDMRLNEEFKPGVALFFDDGMSGAYVYALPLMRARCLRATTCVITNSVGAGAYMTVDQLLALQGAGWTVANHTTDHTDLTTLSQANAQIKIGDARDALLAWGLQGGNYVAYPFNAVNATVLAAMAAESMLLGRRGLNLPFLIPYTEAYQLPSREIANTTSLATAKGWVDTAKAAGKIQGLFLHQLVEGAPGVREWGVGDFEDLLDYIVAEDMAVLTMDDIYNLYSRAIRIPKAA